MLAETHDGLMHPGAARQGQGLPPGLKVDARTPAGISGTPTTAGTFTFTVAVTDKPGTQTTEPGSITIQP